MYLQLTSFEKLFIAVCTFLLVGTTELTMGTHVECSLGARAFAARSPFTCWALFAKSC